MVTLFRRAEGHFKDPRVCLIWSKGFSALIRTLSFNLIREICLYLTPNYLLADLRKNSLRFLNARTQTRTPQVSLHCTIALSDSSRWILLHNGKILCCGGKNSNYHLDKDWMASVYVVNYTGAVDKLPALQKARGLHGLIQWRDYALLFGGDNCGPLKECESLLLPRAHCWQALPAMTSARHSFNPCLLHDIVYLYGYGSQALEGFAPQQNHYIPLSVHFPKLANCCLYVNRGFLVIISPALLVQYKPGEGQLGEEGRVVGVRFPKTQNSQPVVDETSRRVFGLLGGKCWSFDMDLGTGS